MICPNCNLTGLDPKTRALCSTCNGSPENAPEPVEETPTEESKLAKAVKKAVKKKK